MMIARTMTAAKTAAMISHLFDLKKKKEKHFSCLNRNSLTCKARGKRRIAISRSSRLNDDDDDDDELIDRE